jgi:hypothetical protein
MPNITEEAIYVHRYKSDYVHMYQNVCIFCGMRIGLKIYREVAGMEFLNYSFVVLK